MIIINPNFKLQPVADVQDQIELQELKNLIEEFIHENVQPIVAAGQKQNAFYVSGMAKKHHFGLIDYLKRHWHRKQNSTLNLTNGYFANFPTEHYWIKAGNMIIDVTIRQFADKPVELAQTIKDALKCDCFICDNPNNPIYQLYA